MMKKAVLFLIPLVLFGLSGCSPLRSSPHDEKHQLELTLHEVQTNLDDLRHDVNCYQAEIQILDGRIKYYENALANLKQQDLEKQQAKIDQLALQLHSLERKYLFFEKNHGSSETELHQLSSHANETNAALAQFKNRLQELEGDLLLQSRRFDEVAKLKGHIETIAKGLQNSEGYKTYKVRSGDSLEKIARSHKIGVDRIRKCNGLEQDLIVVGQELKIPNE